MRKTAATFVTALLLASAALTGGALAQGGRPGSAPAATQQEVAALAKQLEALRTDHNKLKADFADLKSRLRQWREAIDAWRGHHFIQNIPE